MSNTSFALNDQFSSFIKAQVETGRYQNASEVVRSGLRLLQAEEAKLEALQQALIAGEQSGEAVAFDFTAYRAGKSAG